MQEMQEFAFNVYMHVAECTSHLLEPFPYQMFPFFNSPKASKSASLLANSYESFCSSLFHMLLQNEQPKMPHFRFRWRLFNASWLFSNGFSSSPAQHNRHRRPSYPSIIPAKLDKIVSTSLCLVHAKLQCANATMPSSCLIAIMSFP